MPLPEILQKYNITETYTPDEEESKFLVDAYKKFSDCRELKLQGYDILGGRTLQEYWDDSNYDYNVLTDDTSDNDPVTPYASNIARDKSDDFIDNLTLQVLYPSVTAQNQNQEIDQIMGKVSRSLLEWAYKNDGRPAESGHQKQKKYVHKQVIEGTVHVQDDVIDGELESSLVPNEEIYIPNFWQGNLQKQPYLFRVQDHVLYEEAREEFGDLDNFKYVIPGNSNNWTISNSEFKDFDIGIIEEDEVQIIRMWQNIHPKDFKKYKIPKNKKRAKLFNVLINGVPMFDIDKVMPYEDGFYPINKGVFARFSKAEFYWGNSMPNKCLQDKKFLDGWKTLVRYKQKLSIIKPLISYNGNFVDSDIFIPGEVSVAPAGMKKDDLDVVPGVGEGVSNADMAIMADAKNEINSGSLSPQASGKQSDRDQTAREAIIRETNEQKILGSVGLEIAFLMEARAFPIIKRLYQFLPRQSIKKIAIPDQDLGNGMRGNLEIIFEKNQAENAEQDFNQRLDMFKRERRMAQAGFPVKSIKINPEYLNNINLYLEAVADTSPKKTSAFRKLEAQEKFGIYAQRPDLFNAQAAARKLVREMGDDEQEMINTQPVQPPGQPASGQRPNNQANQLNRLKGQETANLGELI